MTSIENKDVIVVGAGIFGLCAAYACALRGLSVALLDAGQSGMGASGGLVGAMSPHTPDNWNAKKQFQFDALDRAADFWTEVDARSGLNSGYGRIGRIFPIPDERLYKLATVRSINAVDIWQGRYHWNVLDNHPLIARNETPFGVVHDTFSARIHPAQACASLLDAARDLGVEVFENTCVTGLGDHMVSGDWGRAHADTIVFAAGTEGFHLLDCQYDTTTGTGVKGQAALLGANLGDVPQISAEGIYIIPHVDGSVGVGSTSETKWAQPFETDGQLDDVVALAKRICPTLADALVIKRWAGLRPKARKRTPLVGPLPELAGVYAAMGGFKIGFGIAHCIGEYMADYAQQLDVDLPRNFTIEHHLS